MIKIKIFVSFVILCVLIIALAQCGIALQVPGGYGGELTEARQLLGSIILLSAIVAIPIAALCWRWGYR